MREDSKYIYTDEEALEDLLIIIKLFYWLNAIIFLIELHTVCAGLLGIGYLINGGLVLISLFLLFMFSLLFLLLITINKKSNLYLLLKLYVIQIITIAPFIWAFRAIVI